VKFVGTASQADINSIVGKDNSLTVTGPSNIRLVVVEAQEPINGVLNTMDLSPGLDTKNYGSIGEGANRVGGDQAHIDTNKFLSNDAAAHDILHFAGIQDRYQEGPLDAQGNRTSKPSPGYTSSNIMAARGGKELKPEQLKEAVENPQHIRSISLRAGHRMIFALNIAIVLVIISACMTSSSKTHAKVPVCVWRGADDGLTVRLTDQLEGRINDTRSLVVGRCDLKDQPTITLPTVNWKKQGASIHVTATVILAGSNLTAPVTIEAHCSDERLIDCANGIVNRSLLAWHIRQPSPKRVP
jgi:hypothetical protein